MRGNQRLWFALPLLGSTLPPPAASPMANQLSSPATTHSLCFEVNRHFTVLRWEEAWASMLSAIGFEPRANLRARDFAIYGAEQRTKHLLGSRSGSGPWDLESPEGLVMRREFLNVLEGVVCQPQVKAARVELASMSEVQRRIEVDVVKALSAKSIASDPDPLRALDPQSWTFETTRDEQDHEVFLRLFFVANTIRFQDMVLQTKRKVDVFTLATSANQRRSS